ncbi:MAG: hypothetical protein D6681_07620 [Calditrichaeota bacterium]|nr:MAG: hypothetical protein D6681_07620 [Calditrichota bacterium]
MRRYLSVSVLVGLLLILVAVPSLHAQALWIHSSTDRGVALEALKPTFDDNEGIRFTTSALYFSGYTRFGDHWRIVGELPIAHYGIKRTIEGAGNFEKTETTVGNPYLGVQYQTTERRFTADVGIRIPLASEEKTFATQAGQVTDLERWDAFMPNSLGFIGIGQYRYRFENGLVTGVRGGGSFLINTDKQEGEDASDLYLLYGVFAGYEAPRFNIMGNFSGRFLTTSDEGGFGENSLHLLALSANYKAGKVWPGVMFKLPLDEDLSNVLDFVAGLQLAVNLK